MAWTLNADKPIYSQLIEIIQMQIISGIYKAGDKLPSARELAAEASVNPNTMQKAFAELERHGLIVTQRTSGRAVTEDIALIDKTRAELAEEYIKEFFRIMKTLGFTKTEIITLVEETTKEDADHGSIS